MKLGDRNSVNKIKRAVPAQVGLVGQNNKTQELGPACDPHIQYKQAYTNKHLKRGSTLTHTSFYKLDDLQAIKSRQQSM